MALRPLSWWHHENLVAMGTCVQWGMIAKVSRST